METQNFDNAYLTCYAVRAVMFRDGTDSPLRLMKPSDAQKELENLAGSIIDQWQTKGLSLSPGDKLRLMHLILETTYELERIVKLQELLIRAEQEEI